MTTHASIHDGVMTFEDGTQIHGVTVELISAAPCILEALETAVNALRQYKGSTSYFAIDKACHAIAKAKGKYQSADSVS